MRGISWCSAKTVEEKKAVTLIKRLVNVKAKVLVKALIDTLAEEKTKALIRTQFKVNSEGLLNALWNTLAGVKVQTRTETLPDVKI